MARPRRGGHQKGSVNEDSLWDSVRRLAKPNDRMSVVNKEPYPGTEKKKNAFFGHFAILVVYADRPKLWFSPTYERHDDGGGKILRILPAKEA